MFCDFTPGHLSACVFQNQNLSNSGMSIISQFSRFVLISFLAGFCHLNQLWGGSTSRNWEDESYVTHRKVTFGPLRSSVIETPWKAPKSPLNKSYTIKFFFVFPSINCFFFCSFSCYFISLSESVAIRNNDRITDTNRPFFQSAPSLKSFFFKNLLLFSLNSD